MEQFKQFSIEKQAAVESLEKLKGILKELDNLGIDVDGDLQKIGSALESIGSDVLRIALLGAFSDGKTSVIASWLGRLMEDMKIDMDESSDRLAIYKPEGLPDQCEIIDTPGLFGDKELTLEGKQVMYADLTKRYISEAHLIIYVVDATNPLKESHNTIAKWLLRDLNKLSSTVFVINKMDEATDLTEQALFTEQARIKKDNLKGKLQRAADLTADELARLNIVCIAANPNGRGLEFWFGKPVNYESRSRINDLKGMTERILRNSVPEILIAKTGLDVVRDVVGQRVAGVQAEMIRLEAFAQQNESDSARFQQDIIRGKKEVKAYTRELFNELDTMEKQLMARLRSLSLDDIRGFLEDELGYAEAGVGHKLRLKIKMAIDHYFVQSSAVTKRISDEVTRQLDSSESFISSIGESALRSAGRMAQGISKISPSAIKSTIMAARDAVATTTGYTYKFAPWGATNLAAGVAKWAGPAGAAFQIGSDVYAAYKAHELEQELAQSRAEIGKIIKDNFKDIHDILSDDEKMFSLFAPQIKQFEMIVADLGQKADLVRAGRESLASMQTQLSRLALPGDALGKAGS